MGMTIDNAIKRYKNNAEFERVHDSLQGYLEFKQLAEWLEQYQKLKADYNARLKADLKAILVELQLQMEEYEPKWVENDEQAVASNRTWEDLDDIIRERINLLKDDGGKKV